MKQIKTTKPITPAKHRSEWHWKCCTNKQKRSQTRCIRNLQDLFAVSPRLALYSLLFQYVDRCFNVFYSAFSSHLTLKKIFLFKIKNQIWMRKTNSHFLSIFSLGTNFLIKFEILTFSKHNKFCQILIQNSTVSCIFVVILERSTPARSFVPLRSVRDADCLESVRFDGRRMWVYSLRLTGFWKIWGKKITHSFTGGFLSSPLPNKIMREMKINLIIFNDFESELFCISLGWCELGDEFWMLSFG